MSQTTQDGNGSARRKTFVACGHRGFGQFCHRCAQADSLEKSKGDPVVIAARVRKLREAPKAKTAPFISASISVPQ